LNKHVRRVEQHHKKYADDSYGRAEQCSSLQEMPSPQHKNRQEKKRNKVQKAYEGFRASVAAIVHGKSIDGNWRLNAKTYHATNQ
jgi:hypothetical protein